MWKHVEDPGRTQITEWRTRITRLLISDTYTYSGYVVLIAFPLQQWLHGRVSLLVISTRPAWLNVKPAGASSNQQASERLKLTVYHLH